MPYKDPEKKKEYYHRHAKAHLYEWRKKSSHWNDYQREYARKRRAKQSDWEKIKADPERLKKSKERTRAYQQKNKEELNRRERKRTEILADEYVAGQLEKEGIPRDISYAHPEIIEAKRIILKIKRQK